MSYLTVSTQYHVCSCPCTGSQGSSHGLPSEVGVAAMGAAVEQGVVAEGGGESNGKSNGESSTPNGESSTPNGEDPKDKLQDNPQDKPQDNPPPQV
jgi:hypothetical protein